mmetsp:Transcript_4292/g.6352  ORF Transcript_4292/g.6352 Transcript_4292/m.6352 type:complete len:496 (-) Transcript_4292:59-1546(-)|eukprot:CAMPEP_0172429300 /NCGR_PEP_ID=MMETSP1064-20121228/49785_1 /TAXON_ID=202472 /ORGANISM="Aulacoseira subarctica , Strain CCAP 1002/5" /LENGTH=495 /DNA_ID=CAMNT_0013174607 /DNA_START=43 /DNA_END=1530 /DNA_ORIENTATION=-
MSTNSNNIETHVLEAETELRMEVPYNSAGRHCNLRLTAGSAEIFGVELALNRWYDFSCCKIAVFTWHGCTVEVQSGTYSVLYESDETNSNIAYVNTHAQLEVLRDDALQAALQQQQQAEESNNNNNNILGPRVLIAGPADSGKTTLALTLSTYAAKVSRTPLLIDLDVSCNLWSVPGTLSVAPVTMDATSVVTTLDSSQSSPLVYWYGHTDGMENTDLCRILISQMAKSIKDRLLVSPPEDAASGFIVNTPGCFMEGEGYEILLHVVEQMDINVILVMGHDRLYSVLKSHFQKQQTTTAAANIMKVIKLPRSGGVVSRDNEFRNRLRSNSIRRYFHGEVVPYPSTATDPTTTLVYRFTPNLIELHFDDLEIYKTSQVSLSKGMLPVIGVQRTSKVQLVKVDKSSYAKNMIHLVLAVCHPAAVEAYEKRLSNKEDGLYEDDDDDNTAEEELYRSSVAGFLVIEKVDLEKERFSFLSPCSGDLPSRTLLVGDVSWME